MTTVQRFHCPHHGEFDYYVVGEVPDSVPCPKYLGNEGRLSLTCGETSEWRLSAPSVRTPDSSRRALTGMVRDTNKWEKPE